MIDKLKKQFEIYEGSNLFIESAFTAFAKCNKKERQIMWFINNHFKIHDECDFIQMKKCAAHWNNIAFDKLNNHDYLSYKQANVMVSDYRIMCKEMEQYINNYEL